MRRLQELEFIDIKPGLASELEYVLIWNPVHAIATAYERANLPDDLAYSALKVRLIEVGADDLEDASEQRPDDEDRDPRD